ncbi:MAG: hypothetical protein QM765_30595 [Myxococcales bacterium]
MDLLLVSMLLLAAASTPEATPPAPTPPIAPTEDAAAPVEETGLRFGLGAQTELITPDVGISGVLASLDFGRLEVETSVGIGVFEQGANSLGKNNIYSIGVRLALQVHSRKRADFAVGVGGGLFVIDTPQDGVDLAWTVLAGARVRIFVVSNVAIIGTLGGGLLLRSQGNAFILGARPLGSAGFVYYF